MNYELVLELKKAGFPQEGNGESTINPYCPNAGKPHEDDDCVIYCPTLSELIEACGEPFLLLKQNISEPTFKRWEAGSYWNKKTNQCFAITPEEAVARLWLALNKK